MNAVPPPVALRVAACTVIFLGGVDLGKTFYRTVTGTGLFVGFGMLGIPIGAALLRGSVAARRLTFVVYVLVALVVGWSFFTNGQVVRFPSGSAHEWMFLAPDLFIAACWLVVPALLLLPGVKRWTFLAAAEKGTQAWWAWPLAFAGLIYSSADEYGDYWTRQTAKGFFRVDSTFTVFRADTGEHVARPTLDTPGVSSRGDPLRPQFAISLTSTANFHIDGFSGKPFTVTFSAAGLERGEYEVTKNTPREVEIRLAPLSPLNGDPAQ